MQNSERGAVMKIAKVNKTQDMNNNKEECLKTSCDYIRSAIDSLSSVAEDDVVKDYISNLSVVLFDIGK